MTSDIRPQPGILDIALYQGGASHIPGREEVLKLSSNENPFGPSSAAQAAVAAAAVSMHRYPSSDHAALRACIGKIFDLEPDQIICGAGSDEILYALCQAYAGPGDVVIYTQHGFSLYKVAARAAGARPVVVPECDRVVDVDAVANAVGPSTRIVFITNPGNPTGTILPEAELARLADALPASVLLVLDGAYAEFAHGHDGGAALAGARPNVVMTRTLSKLYGLGGLRVGWAYASREIIDVLNRIRGPFNLSTVQLAGAEAALRDHEHVELCLRENSRLREWLANALRRAGVSCDESHANFVLARFTSPA
ncbi:MAG: histidinol-phosphate transaminase, partial [Pseudomonadota bacterium]